MNKINVVLVVLNNKFLKQTVGTLNFNRANLVAVIVENIQEPILSLGSKEIPLVPFSMIQKLLDAGKNFFWLIEWLANLDYIKKHGADFFATGISYTEVGLDLNYIPHLRGRGVNLSGSNQDLHRVI